MKFLLFFLKAIFIFLLSFLFLMIIPHFHPEKEIFVPSNCPVEVRISKFAGVAYPFLNFLVNPTKIRFGVYKIKKNASYLSVLKTIYSNKQVFLPFKIREGSSSVEILEHINEDQNFRGKIVTELKDGVVIPNTYHFAYGTIRSVAIKHILDQSEVKRKLIWRESAFKDQNEWITMASILEKEGISYEDKQRIAGVILNRIKKKMRLEMCSTAIYVKTNGKYDKGLTWKEICSRKFTSESDLNANYKSAYNTYANRGLPPGPICNPGVESLKAALNAEIHEYYYYRLINGKHVFSKTFDEHKSLM